jgi:hypothetical protein
MEKILYREANIRTLGQKSPKFVDPETSFAVLTRSTNVSCPKPHKSSSHLMLSFNMYFLFTFRPSKWVLSVRLSIVFVISPIRATLPPTHAGTHARTHTHFRFYLFYVFYIRYLNLVSTTSNFVTCKMSQKERDHWKTKTQVRGQY